MDTNRFDYITKYSDKIPENIQTILNDIVENHNHSWYREIYDRNKDKLNAPALFYRGATINYKEMFEKARQYAKSLLTKGCTKGSEIPMCVSNCPETVYMLLAISMIGAKANLFNEEFDKDYILEIINNSNSKLLFSTDNVYDKIKDVVEESNVSESVVFSLTDSLPNNKDPYKELDDDFYVFENKLDELKANTNNTMVSNQKEFIDSGKDYDGKIEVESELDDDFLITYTSGSTNTTRPKAIVHRNSSPIVIARFHDKDASNLPTIKNFRTLAQIPTHSNTDIITSISDTLSMKCTVALEPIYDKHFFLRSLIINKANYVLATRCFWLEAFKEIYNNPNLRKLRMPFLLMPTEVGEPLAPSEEKFLNKMLVRLKAGLGIIPLPISPVCMSVGGGDCEHGGLFFTFFRALKQKSPKHLADDKYDFGMEPFKMVDACVLDENGMPCKNGEMGNLVANSPCTMKEYYNNKDATDKFFVKDGLGRKWADCDVHAYIDKHNNIHMKGRKGNEIALSNGKRVPLFKITDIVLKDTKNILSCEVIKDASNLIVIHFECQPNIRNQEKILKTMMSIEQRCKSLLPKEISDKIVYRYRNSKISFPTTGCGKRNNLELQKEGINNTMKPIYNNGKIELLSASEIFQPEIKEKVI